MKKQNWWWIALIIAALLAANAGSIFFIISNCITIEDNGSYDVSYWDLITNKFIAKSIYGDDFLTYYRMWKKPVVFFCMFIGWVISAVMSWSLIKHSSYLKVENRKIVSNEKIAKENQAAMIDAIEKISLKQSEKEAKEREKYIRGI